MSYKGTVTKILGNKCKVYIKSKEYESSFLDIAKHLSLSIGDTVVVTFYSNTMSDGIVLAKL